MHFLRQNSVFIILSLLLILVLSAALVCVPKAELHLWLCDRHTPAGDIFFRYYTSVGEWVPYCVCFALLFYKAGYAVFTLSGTLLAGLTTQILKRIVDAPRPLTWFAANYPDIQLPLVEGVRMSRFYSFPSGHTTTFFALFFALCIIGTYSLSLRQRHGNDTATTRQRQQLTSGRAYATWLSVLWQIVCFALAVLGAYSRIYLSQHFAADILGGMCVGIVITALSYLLLGQQMDKKWWNWHFFAKKTS
ncbi:MAG: phosphatase PAP2 family protein [Paludibacteraceae bacterium]